MGDKFVMSARQADELDYALGRCGWSAADIKRLCEGDMAATLLLVIRGHAEVVQVKHFINCDADPFLPKGWKGVEFHRKQGQFLWEPEKVRLHLAEGQQSGSVVGTDLRTALEGKPVLNANVLDYLLAHPHLIPESWKGKLVFFWGTIYRLADGSLCVRYLSWDGSRWHWSCGWLDGRWRGRNPAAVLCE